MDKNKTLNSNTLIKKRVILNKKIIEVRLMQSLKTLCARSTSIKKATSDLGLSGPENKQKLHFRIGLRKVVHTASTSNGSTKVII